MRFLFAVGEVGVSYEGGVHIRDKHYSQEVTLSIPSPGPEVNIPQRTSPASVCYLECDTDTAACFDTFIRFNI